MKTCEECGEEIHPNRVAVNPNVRFCFDCQEIAERSGKFIRHRMKHELRFNADGTEIESMDGVIVRAKN